MTKKRIPCIHEIPSKRVFFIQHSSSFTIYEDLTVKNPKQQPVFTLKQTMLQLYAARKALKKAICSVCLIIVFFILWKILSHEIPLPIDKNSELTLHYYRNISLWSAIITSLYLAWQLKTVFIDSYRVLCLKSKDVKGLFTCSCETSHLFCAKYSLYTNNHARIILYIQCEKCNHLFYKCNSET